MAGSSLGIPSEDAEGRMLAKWMQWRGILFTHVPNGGERNVRVGARLKRQGTKAGVPDYLIFARVPKLPGARGVAIELKRRKGGRLTKLQAQWLVDLIAEGWIAMQCDGAEAAIAELQALGF